MLGPHLPGTIGGMERHLVRPSPLDQIKGLWSLSPSTTSSWYLIDGDCFCCVLLVGISFSSQRTVSMVCLGGPSPRVWWKFLSCALPCWLCVLLMCVTVASQQTCITKLQEDQKQWVTHSADPLYTIHCVFHWFLLFFTGSFAIIVRAMTCWSMEQSARSCHFRTFCSSLPVPA